MATHSRLLPTRRRRQWPRPIGPDGSWLKTTIQTGSESCNKATGGKLSIGTHTMRLMDSKGNLLAEASYTLTP